jgi:hypothetical protein
VDWVYIAAAAAAAAASSTVQGQGGYHSQSKFMQTVVRVHEKHMTPKACTQ